MKEKVIDADRSRRQEPGLKDIAHLRHRYLHLLLILRDRSFPLGYTVIRLMFTIMYYRILSDSVSGLSW